MKLTERQAVKQKITYIGSWDDIEYAASSAGLIDAGEKITEQQVRFNGYVCVYGNDPERDCRVVYKHIGDCLSENAFVGAIEVKDRKRWVTVFKKFSDKFKDVKITWRMLEELNKKRKENEQKEEAIHEDFDV